MEPVVELGIVIDSAVPQDFRLCADDDVAPLICAFLCDAHAYVHLYGCLSGAHQQCSGSSSDVSVLHTLATSLGAPICNDVLLI